MYDVWKIGDGPDILAYLTESIEKGELTIMATRGAIARKTDNGFIANYHHWDSYPSSLGQMLYTLYHGHFQRDIAAMLHTLIEEHPAGWSSINNADFALKPGFTPFEGNGGDYDAWVQAQAIYDESDDGRRPQCYCHGKRHEDAHPIENWNDASQMGCEYLYLIDEQQRTMTIYSRRDNWLLGTTIHLDDPEPDWLAME